MRTIRLQIAATEAHCGRPDGGALCHLLNPYRLGCLMFPGSRVSPDGDEYKRLPECIAAENSAPTEAQKEQER